MEYGVSSKENGGSGEIENRRKDEFRIMNGEQSNIETFVSKNQSLYISLCKMKKF